MRLLASVCAGTMVAAGLSAASPAVAQVIRLPAASVSNGFSLRVFEIIRIADVLRSDDDGRGPYAAVPDEALPDDEEVFLAPEEIPSLLREHGFSPLGPVFRRGSVYTVAVLDENGEDGRLIVDARTGEAVRFIPAMRMDSRLSEELDRVYGPRGAPPAAFARNPRDAPYRTAPAPRTADHAPLPQSHRSAPPKRIAKPAAPNPAAAQMKAQNKAPENKENAARSARLAQPPAASGPPPVMEPPRIEAKPETRPEADTASVELKPTGPMPPVQPMD